MENFEITSDDVVAVMNVDFPKELALCVQKIHIKKLEDKIRELEEFTSVVKEPNG